VLSLLALLAGGALAAGVYHRFWSVGDPNSRSLVAAGVGGAIAGWLLLWVIQTGIGRIVSGAGTVLVLLVIAATVIPVVAVSLLGARKANDVRISAKLRWERSHPHVSDLHADGEE
jgi:hypothetical protein